MAQSKPYKTHIKSDKFCQAKILKDVKKIDRDHNILVARSIKERLKELKISEAELARRASVHPNRIRSMRLGGNVSMYTWLRVCKVLGIFSYSQNNDILFKTIEDKDRVIDDLRHIIDTNCNQPKSRIRTALRKLTRRPTA